MPGSLVQWFLTLTTKQEELGSISTQDKKLLDRSVYECNLSPWVGS